MSIIFYALFYISNHTLQSDHKISHASAFAKIHYKRFNSR